MSQVETSARIGLSDDGHLVVSGLTFLNSIGKGSYGEVALATDEKQGGRQVVSVVFVVSFRNGKSKLREMRVLHELA
jgi:hypothetical protein